MNSKFIKISLIFISGSVLFLAGCGPQDANDAENVAQIADSRASNDILNKDDQAEDKGCPTGNCEIPLDADTHRTVQLPDQVVAEPVKVTPTSEQQVATDIVDFHTTRHIMQPSERHHVVNKHRNLIKRNFLKIVYHPTSRRINSVVRTGSAESQVMPTEEVVEPTIDYGCAGAPIEAPVVEPVPVFQPAPYLGWGYGRGGWWGRGGHGFGRHGRR